MSKPKKACDLMPEIDQSYVSSLVECYSSDKQLLQQAIKDLEHRIRSKAQQLAVEKEVLKQLLDKLQSWGE